MKDEGLFGRGGKKGTGAEAWKKVEGEKAKGNKVRVEKGGGSGCCNTATYSTGEGGAAMERERGEKGERRERKKAKGGKAEEVVAVIQ